MDSGTIAIKKNMDKIESMSYSTDGTIKLGNNTLIVEGSILNIHDLMNNCCGKTLVKIEFNTLPYDDFHPFEGYTTYHGGVEEWNVYRSYTFQFDDDTCSTIEVKYTSREGLNPNMYFIH